MLYWLYYYSYPNFSPLSPPKFLPGTARPTQSASYACQFICCLRPPTSPGRSWNVPVGLHLPPPCLLHHPAYSVAPSVNFRILLNVTVWMKPSMITHLKTMYHLPLYLLSLLPALFFCIWHTFKVALHFLVLFIVCLSAPEGKVSRAGLLLSFFVSCFSSYPRHLK